MANEEDYYALLGVRVDASDLEIRRAYRQRVLELHPDRRPGDAAAEAQFKKVSQAYAVLGARDRRARYDASRVQEDVVGLARAAAPATSPRPIATREIRPTPRGIRFADGDAAATRLLQGTLRTEDALAAVVVTALGWELTGNAPHWIATAAATGAVLAAATLSFRLVNAADANARFPAVSPALAGTTLASTMAAGAVAFLGLRGHSDAAWFLVAAMSSAMGSTLARSVGRAFFAEAASKSGRLFARTTGALCGALVAAVTVTIPLGLAALAAFVSSISEGMFHAAVAAVLSATLCGFLFRGDSR